MGGCKASRSLEEVEAALTPPEGATTVEAPADPESLEGRSHRVQRLFARNTLPWKSPEPVAVEPGSPYVLPLSSEAYRCITAWAVGEPAAHVLHLSLRDTGGRVMADDRARDSFPVVQNVCLEPDANYTLHLETASTTEPTTALLRIAEVRDGLEVGATRQLEMLRERYAPGSQAEGPPHEVHLQQGDRHRASVALRAGACYAILGVSETSASTTAPYTRGLDARPAGRPGGLPALNRNPPWEVDLRLLDESGRTLMADLGTDERPVIARFCPDESAVHRLDVAMYQGAGIFFWQLFRHPER